MWGGVFVERGMVWKGVFVERGMVWKGVFVERGVWCGKGYLLREGYGVERGIC